jgi:hypothetical protein
MASMHDGESDSEHNALWLYGLPGSGVAVPQAAGAPSLEELELRPAEPAGLNARIWICYGSLTQGLVELVNRLQPPPQAAELEAKAKAKVHPRPRKIVAGVRNCNVPLMCPYGEKDDVKQLGGLWNNEERQWYVPAGLELAPFSRWNAEAFTYLRFAWRDEALRSRINAQGAEFDGKTKLWYVRGNTDLRPFAQWRI